MNARASADAPPARRRSAGEVDQAQGDGELVAELLGGGQRAFEYITGIVEAPVDHPQAAHHVPHRRDAPRVAELSSAASASVEPRVSVGLAGERRRAYARTNLTMATPHSSPASTSSASAAAADPPRRRSRLAHPESPIEVERPPAIAREIALHRETARRPVAISSRLPCSAQREAPQEERQVCTPIAVTTPTQGSADVVGLGIKRLLPLALGGWRSPSSAPSAARDSAPNRSKALSGSPFPPAARRRTRRSCATGRSASHRGEAPGDDALVDQRRDTSTTSGHASDGLAQCAIVKLPGKNRGSIRAALLVGREQLVAPRDRSLERPLPRGASRALRRDLAGSAPGAARGVSTRRRESGRELDRERHAFEPAADVRDDWLPSPESSGRPHRRRGAPNRLGGVTLDRAAAAGQLPFPETRRSSRLVTSAASSGLASTSAVTTGAAATTCSKLSITSSSRRERRYAAIAGRGRRRARAAERFGDRRRHQVGAVDTVKRDESRRRRTAPARPRAASTRAASSRPRPAVG